MRDAESGPPGVRPATPPDVLRSRLRALHEKVGAPSLDTLVTAAGRAGATESFSKATFSNLLTGRRTRVEAVEAFVLACAHHARNRRPRIPLDAADLDLAGWRRAHAATRPPINALSTTAGHAASRSVERAPSVGALLGAAVGVGQEPSGSPSWPVVVGDPPLVVTAYQRRPEAERQLTEALEPAGSTTVLTQVLSGDGGVGKTQLAAHTFETARLKPGCDLAVWVDASSTDAVINGLAAALTRIRPALGPEDPAAAARQFLSWLRETDRGWLVVLDNVMDPAHLDGWWPTGPSGRTLVTTRRRDAVLSDMRRTVVELDVFRPDEARAYLTQRLRLPDSRPDVLVGADELAVELGHLPLALAQAAAVILNDGITCAGFGVRFQDRSLRLAEVFGPSADPSRTVAATWALAAEAADALAPAGVARRLLAVIAMLDPDGIPAVVLDAVETLLGDAGPDAPGRAGVAAALRNLHRLSLVTHGPASAHRTVRMHALAKRATVESLEAAERDAASATAAEALASAWPEVENDRALSRALRANAVTLSGAQGGRLWSDGMHPVLSLLGSSYHESGAVTAACEYWGRLHTEAIRRLGRDHPHTLQIRNNHASSIGKAGRPTEAVREFKALADELGRLLGPLHWQTLVARSNAAYWTGDAGDAAGAAAALEELLADARSAAAPDRRLLVRVRMNLARWRGEMGEWATAVAMLEELLEERSLLEGAEAIVSLTIRHELACNRVHLDTAAAIVELEAVVVDQVGLLGPTHPDTLRTRANLAVWRPQLERATVEAELRAVVEDKVEALGRDHPETLISRGNLAVFIAGQAGDPLAWGEVEAVLDDALHILGPDHVSTLRIRAPLELRALEAPDGPTRLPASLRDLLARQVRALGRDHPFTLETQRRVVNLYAAGTAPDTGVLRDLFDLMAQLRGSNDPLAAIVRTRLGMRLLETGDGPAARAALEGVLTAVRRSPESPSVILTVLDMIVHAARMSGNDADLLTCYRRLLAEQRVLLGPADERTLSSRMSVAQLCGETSRPAEAVTEYRRLLPDLVRVLGPRHARTLTARANLAHWLGETGQFDRAADEFADVLPDLSEVFGPDHPDTLKVRYNLAHRRGQAGDPRYAATQLRRLLPELIRALGPRDATIGVVRHNLLHWQQVADRRQPGALWTPGSGQHRGR